MEKIGGIDMKSIFSEACRHNQHELCNEQECNCGCHYIKKNGGLTPEEFKLKMSAIAIMEGAV